MSIGGLSSVLMLYSRHSWALKALSIHLLPLVSEGGGVEELFCEWL